MTTATILGAGTLLPDAERGSPSHHVQGEHFSLLLDCGSGAMHGMARFGIRWRHLSHFALSHFHTDHTGDLAALLWAFRHGAEERDAPLTLLGPAGFRRYMKSLARAHGDFILDPGFPLHIVECVGGEEWRDEEGDLAISTCATPHVEGSLAFRVESEGAIIGYTGDTGPSRELGGFLGGADLLIAECAVARNSAEGNHLTPDDVAEVLREACPDTTVLTHLYPPLDPTTLPDLIRGLGVTGTVIAGRDGMRFPIPTRART
ncbi:MAG: ribonuclease Z [Gemmatimonadota bacterium]